MLKSNNNIIFHIPIYTPCNWRFFQNDYIQLPCRTMQGGVTRAIWDCLLEEFRHVKVTYVLHNFMRMDTRNRRGSAVRYRVPEEKSAALQEVLKMGSKQHSKRQSVCGISSSPTSSKRVLFPGNTMYCIVLCKIKRLF